MKDKKIIFMGTPLFAVPVLENLIKYTTVVAVVTQPDKIVGRKKILTPSPVKEVAIRNNIKVLQPEKLKNDYSDILDIDASVIITCAYGQMIPEEVIYSKEFNTINVHASLLPKYRGGAPIQRAILNGDKKTGITIMETDKGMDSGNIIVKEELDIMDDDNYDSLSSKLSSLGADLLIRTLPSIFDKSALSIKQNDADVSFAYTIKREDEHLDFNDTAINIYNKIRALSSTPGSYALLDDKEVKIYDARINNMDTKKDCGVIGNIYKDGIGVATKDKELVITKLQVPGKKIMLAKDYLNGVKKEDLLGKMFK